MPFSAPSSARRTCWPARLAPTSIALLKPFGSRYFAGAQSLESHLPDPRGAQGATVILCLCDVRQAGRTLVSAQGLAAHAIFPDIPVAVAVSATMGGAMVATMKAPIFSALFVMVLVQREAAPVIAIAVIDGVAEHGGRLNYRNGFVYVVASAVGIGAGAPVGADTPSAMIGEHLASWLGQRFHQRELFMRALVVAGLGAGISATFFAQDTEGLKVLGAENVFVTSQPGASSKEAYEKAQQLIHP